MKVRIQLRGHYYSVRVYSYNVSYQGSPSLKRPLTNILIFEQLRFRNGFIILMLIVKNRIIV